MGLRQWMRRFPEAADGQAPFAPYLEDGETLRQIVYARRAPGCLASLPLYALGGSGAIFNASLHYLVGLTDRRLIVLQIENIGNAVKTETAWPLAALPPGRVAKGWLEIDDPAQPIKAIVFKGSVPGYPDAPQAIGAALSGGAAG